MYTKISAVTTAENLWNVSLLVVVGKEKALLNWQIFTTFEKTCDDGQITDLPTACTVVDYFQPCLSQVCTQSMLYDELNDYSLLKSLLRSSEYMTGKCTEPDH